MNSDNKVEVTLCNGEIKLWTLVDGPYNSENPEKPDWIIVSDDEGILYGADQNNGRWIISD